MKGTHEMERDPDRLHRLFLAAMANEPPSPSAVEQILVCKRGLKRRRRVSIFASAAVLAALVLVPTALSRNAGTEPSLADPSAGMTPNAIIETCRDGNQSQHATNTLFGSGTPEVRLWGTAASKVSVVLVSADGQYWADCFIDMYDGAEFSSGMTVYGSGGDKPAKGFSYSDGFACRGAAAPPGTPCKTFMVDYVDRVAREVAAVAFNTVDGKTTTVDTKDGFVLFAYMGSIPEGYPTTTDAGGPGSPRWLSRVTYLDDSGNELAAENVGDSRAQGKRVAGLPLLDAYPARRSEPIW